jgi:hypothetical protein
MNARGNHHRSGSGAATEVARPMQRGSDPPTSEKVRFALPIMAIP